MIPGETVAARASRIRGFSISPCRGLHLSSKVFTGSLEADQQVEPVLDQVGQEVGSGSGEYKVQINAVLE